MRAEVSCVLAGLTSGTGVNLNSKSLTQEHGLQTLI